MEYLSAYWRWTMSSTRNKWWGIGGPILVVLLAVGLIFGEEEKEKPSTSRAAATQERAADEPPGPDWKAGAPLTKQSVVAALADGDEMVRSVNLGKPTGVTVNSFDGVVLVDYKASSALSETDLLTVAAHTTFSAIRALFENPNVTQARISVYADFVDRLGKTELERATLGIFTRATADLIDWDGLENRVLGDNKHIFCIAEDWDLHGAIYSRLKDKGCLF